MARKTTLNDDLLITPVMWKRFAEEASFENGPGRYAVMMRRSNGEVVELMDNDFGGKPVNPNCRQIGHDLLLKANDDCHHDGAWVVLMTHPDDALIAGLTFDAFDDLGSVRFKRFVMLWIDEDGDPQFSIDIVEPLWRLQESGLAHWADACEEAWGKWNWAMRDVLAPSAAQKYKRAQGEHAPSGKERVAPEMGNIVGAGETMN